MASPLPNVRVYFADENGAPLVGGKVYTYAAGSGTPKATYTTKAATVENTNPVVLDARGEADIWLGNGGYKIVVKNSADVLRWERDNIESTGDLLAASSGSSLIGFIQSGTGAVARTVQAKLRDVVSVNDFGAIGDGATDARTSFAAADAVGPFSIPAGTYRIASNITLTNSLYFQQGAKLSIDTGVTVTINGYCIASPFQQIFSGSGTVVFGTGSVSCVFPDWWGSGSGAVLLARAAVTGKYIPVRLLPGKTYQFATKMSITDHGAQIIGYNSTNDGEGLSPLGSTLEYTGASGTAIEIGIAPGTNGNFIRKVAIEGFILKVTENTDIALRGWHLAGRSTIKNVTVIGNSDKDGSDNCGIQLDGCIDTVIENILVIGKGSAASTNYLQYGLRILNGYAGSVTTTLRIYNPYITQCNWAAVVEPDSNVAFYSPIFESCYDTGLLSQSARVWLFDPWFEDNSNGTGGSRGAIRCQGANNVLSLYGGTMNMGVLSTFINAEADNIINLFGGTRFASSHATPVLVSTSGSNPTVSVLGENQYAANMVLWESAFAANAKLLAWKAGKLLIGGDTSSTSGISRTLSATSTPALGTINAGTVATFNITVTGADTGANQEAYASPDGDPGAGLIWSARVSGTNTVQVRVANPTSGNIITNNVLWRAGVWKR